MKWVIGALGGLLIVAGVVVPIMSAIVTKAEITRDVVR